MAQIVETYCEDDSNEAGMPRHRTASPHVQVHKICMTAIACRWLDDLDREPRADGR